MRKIVFVLIAFPIVFVITNLPGAFALMLNWNWFLVPLGVMQLTFWHAVGIDALATMPNILPSFPSAKELGPEAAWDFLWNRIKFCWITAATAIVIGAFANYMMGG